MHNGACFGGSCSAILERLKMQERVLNLIFGTPNVINIPIDIGCNGTLAGIGYAQLSLAGDINRQLQANVPAH